MRVGLLMAEISKACPECGNGRLVERENSHNRSHFLGCCNYPKCRHTEPVPAYLELIRQGAAQLPGMESV